MKAETISEVVGLSLIGVFILAGILNVIHSHWEMASIDFCLVALLTNTHKKEG